MKICRAYVHPGFVRHEFMASVLRMKDRYDLEIVQEESGTNVQTARNACLHRFLETDSDFLFFADTDMSWGADVPERLIACDVPIVSALYLGRGPKGEFPVGTGFVRFGEGSVMHNLQLEDLEGLVEVAGVGMGCCMIRREVIHRVMANRSGEHTHNWPFALGELKSPGIDEGVTVSEDINFCLRAKEVGFKSYIASDIPVGHVKAVVIQP